MILTPAEASHAAVSVILSLGSGGFSDAGTERSFNLVSGGTICAVQGEAPTSKINYFCPRAAMGLMGEITWNCDW